MKAAMTKTKKITVWAVLSCILSLTLCSCGARSQPSSHQQQQNQKIPRKNRLIGYLQRGTHTLHLLTSEGQPLAGFNPILGVESYTVFDNFIGYKLTLNHELHVLNLQGQPLAGFIPVRGVDEFSISDQRIAYKLIQNHELHVLNIQGQEILLSGSPSVAHVRSFEISNQLIAYLLEQPLYELHIYDIQGRPISLSGSDSVQNVVNVKISNQIIAYKLGSHELHVVNAQGNEILTSPLQDVYSFKVSNQLIAYTSMLAGDNDLRIMNHQSGNIATVENVSPGADEYRVSDDLIVCIAGTNYDLHILQANGQRLGGLPIIRGVAEIQLSDHMIGYRLDQSQDHELHLLNTQGQALTEFSAGLSFIQNVSHFFLNNEQLAYYIDPGTSSAAEFKFIETSARPFINFNVSNVEIGFPISKSKW